MRRFEIIEAYKDKNINIPCRATDYSAGYDIEAAEDTIIPSIWNQMKWATAPMLPKECVSLKEAKTLLNELGLSATKVPTGLKVYVEPHEYLKIVDRSSIGVNNLLIMPHGEGIIDNDYVDNKDNEGHILIALINLAPFDILIKKGEKIAQGIINRYRVMDNDDLISIEERPERQGGFGSTND